MAPKRLVRTALLTLAVGLVGCGHRKEDTASEAVDLAAIRARRDSLRLVAIRDSVVRARYKECSDSVTAVLAKAAKKAKKKKGAQPEPTVPGMIPPEVLSACGKVPAPKPVSVAQHADTTGHGAAAGGDSAARAMKGKADSAAHLISVATDSAAGAIKGKVEAPAPAPVKPAEDTTKRAKAVAKDTTKLAKDTTKVHKDTTKVAKAPPPAPKLTAKQLAVLRADSLRQAKERAKQDSLKQVAERAHTDSLAKVQRDSVRAESLKVARETEVLRETFTYSGGSRDPFASLITEDKVGPEFNDLVLVGVYLDLRRASNSVAVLRDKTNQKRYKLRVGEHLGRLKVAQIRQSDIVFTVEDIGFERQETLSLKKREDQTP